MWKRELCYGNLYMQFTRLSRAALHLMHNEVGCSIRQMVAARDVGGNNKFIESLRVDGDLARVSFTLFLQQWLLKETIGRGIFEQRSKHCEWIIFREKSVYNWNWPRTKIVLAFYGWVIRLFVQFLNNSRIVSNMKQLLLVTFCNQTWICHIWRKYTNVVN